MTEYDTTAKIRVAAGILFDPVDRILIAQRVGDTPFAGLWEFPGGKIDAEESSHDALRRELHEELGVRNVQFDHFLHLEHRYPDRHVSIDFFIVDAWQGRPRGREGQAIRWLALDKLDEGMLMPADYPVVRALKERRPRSRERCAT